MTDSRKILIAGLGNPGAQYEKTRHNAGFLAVDSLADDAFVQLRTEKMQGYYGSYRLAGKQVFLLEPMTYMNRSGECIAQYARYFDIKPDNVLIIHDDLDLPAGRVKLVAGGGAGGHKGILSTIQHLGTKDFPRMKIGIGRPGNGSENPSIPVEKYVLSRFSDEQWQILQDSLSLVAEGVTLFVEQGITAAMNRVNAKAK